MVKRIRRKFSREYKLDAVRLVNEGGRPMSKIAEELGIRADLLGKWRSEFEAERQANGASEEPLLSKDEEIRRLRRELEIARQERDFLKKAAAYFAKESR